MLCSGPPLSRKVASCRRRRLLERANHDSLPPHERGQVLRMHGAFVARIPPPLAGVRVTDERHRLRSDILCGHASSAIVVELRQISLRWKLAGGGNAAVNPWLETRFSHGRPDGSFHSPRARRATAAVSSAARPGTRAGGPWELQRRAARGAHLSARRERASTDRHSRIARRSSV